MDYWDNCILVGGGCQDESAAGFTRRLSCIGTSFTVSAFYKIDYSYGAAAGTHPRN